MFHIFEQNGKRVLEEVKDGRKIQWMTDSQGELDTAKEFIEASHGDVLMVGLGLGFLVDKITYDTLDIVEREQEVIDLYKGKGNIILGDIFTLDTLPRKYDIIYLDIWQNYFSDKTKDLEILTKKLTPYLKESGQILWWGNREPITRII